MYMSLLSAPPFTVTRTVLTAARIPGTSVMVEIVTCIHGGSAKECDGSVDRTVYPAHEMVCQLRV